jgi:thiol-disulfide isomerase/thioredoxin
LVGHSDGTLRCRMTRPPIQPSICAARRRALCAIPALGAAAIGAAPAALRPTTAQAQPQPQPEPQPQPQPQVAAAARVKMAWPSTITLLDGRPWMPPTAADPAAVILVFWATTCPFCARHNPHVEQLHRAAAGTRLRVLTVAQDPQPAEVMAHLQRHGFQFPVAREYEALRRPFSGRRVIPLTVAIDRDGWVREVIPGEMFRDDVLGFLPAYG